MEEEMRGDTKEAKREGEVLEFLAREVVAKEERSNKTKQTKHGQRSTQ